VIVALGIFLWPATLVLPTLKLRWSLVHFVTRAATWLTGIGVAVAGAWPKEKNVLVAANHSSYVDSLVLAAVIPGEPAFVAKKELAQQFFAGPFLRRLGVLFVERTDAEGGLEDVNKALEAAQAGRKLVFFPEGTLTRAPGLLPFRLGAFVIAARQNLRVLPVTLQGTRSILRNRQWFPRRGAVQVYVGSLISADGQDFAAAIRLRDSVRAKILATSGEPDAAIA